MGNHVVGNQGAHIVGINRTVKTGKEPVNYRLSKRLFTYTWLWNMWQSLCDECGVLAEHPTRAGAESAAMNHYKQGLKHG